MHISDCHANGVCIWLTGISTFLMEKTTTVTADVPKLSAKLVLQATDQHVGGNFDELVLPQRGVSLERLNNFMNLFPVRLHAFLRVLYVLNLFYTMQNSERVGNLAPSMNFGPASACDTTEGKVELVVPRGKVYLESVESPSNLLNKPVSEVPEKKWKAYTIFCVRRRRACLCV